MNIIPSFYQISIYEWTIIGLYLFFFIVQLIFYLYLFSKPYQHLAKSDTSNKESENKGVSVIITAKNEAENLQKNLPFQ